MKKLTLLLAAFAMILVSCKPEIEKPTVVTKSVGEVTETSVKVEGEVTSDGGSDVTARGVLFWKMEGSTKTIDFNTKEGKGLGAFTSEAKDLNPNTTYYVKAYATNEGGTSYGKEMSFTTLEITPEEPENPDTPEDPENPEEPENPDTPEDPEEPEEPEQPEIKKPTVNTKSVSEVTETTAKIVVQVAADGGSGVTERGVCWNTSGSPEIIDFRTVDSGGLGTFTVVINDLEQNTTYYIRGYATNEAGTAYGEELTFTTLEEKKLATVLTLDITEVTHNSAVSGGNVTDDGNCEVTARGVCWSTSQNPTIEDNKTTDGTGLGSYTSNLTNLEANTTYYIRAYATNEAGTAYGDELTFTTLEEKKLATVLTLDITEVTHNSAVSGGNVTDDGNCEVTARGVCWSTSQNPTIEDNKTTDGTGLGSYTSKLTNLESNMTYYVRAYATNEAGTAYGSIYVFETEKETTGTVNGHEWVDLGLPSGLKWATCNVGANNPEEYGNYYAWGETSPKAEYTSENSITFGQQMSDFSGNAQYDAARANWGGSWRMPTKDEMQELVDHCEWEWTTQNGVNGYKVTGTNGNSIFLPAGHRYRSSLSYAGEFGDYWSSTPDYDTDNGAYLLSFYSSEHYMGSYFRYLGRSVRPVVE